jgi:hypothetical protein
MTTGHGKKCDVIHLAYRPWGNKVTQTQAFAMLLSRKEERFLDVSAGRIVDEQRVAVGLRRKKFIYGTSPEQVVRQNFIFHRPHLLGELESFLVTLLQ